ncbi:hypothetical protein QLQ12_07810 [Actinoplanes sp. NEAU-A12]|uniref:Excreted virulence factor EspC (Type VII ESX diderm) n=1 Tax=Actinoplanes sandaracinus TaxID=3045177 RepID=A0ABT6WFM4_9ACTN|nr:hypothetical protein [Actinoplanes sandaracinus]MDI6098507.1 hypothetical protein [Actinoplanes sandaracinus]
MNADFEAEAEGLRRSATAVTGLAGRVSGAAGSVPGTDPAPRWATTGAATLMTESARRLLSLLGHDTAETAERIRAAAAAYEQADARAAARLRQAR